MPRLLVIKGADEGKQFDLAEAVTSLGRDASNVIRLHDTEVSRRHAEICRLGPAFQIRDVGSANGTFVNNQKVAQVELNAGDHIAIGQTVLLYSTGRDDGTVHSTDLAEKINMISRADVELSSALTNTVSAGQGSRL